MENSTIVLFIKFFEGCIISKRMNRAKKWLQFITILLFIIFCGIFINVTIGLDGKNVTNSTVACVTILYCALILMTMYFRKSVVSIFLDNDVKTLVLLKYLNLYKEDFVNAENKLNMKPLTYVMFHPIFKKFMNK